MRSRWSVAVSIPFGWLAACSNANSGFQSDILPGSSGGDDGGGGGSESGIVFTSGFDGGLSLGDSTVSDGSGGGPCKGGHYSGTFAGTYTSHLTGIGFPIPVTGNVDMSLDQVGSDQMVGSSRVDLQACKLEYSIVSPK